MFLHLAQCGKEQYSVRVRTSLYRQHWHMLLNVRCSSSADWVTNIQNPEGCIQQQDAVGGANKKDKEDTVVQISKTHTY